MLLQRHNQWWQNMRFTDVCNIISDPDKNDNNDKKVSTTEQ